MERLPSSVGRVKHSCNSSLVERGTEQLHFFWTKFDTFSIDISTPLINWVSEVEDLVERADQDTKINKGEVRTQLESKREKEHTQDVQHIRCLYITINKECTS